jgi:predicted dehydrogenase
MRVREGAIIGFGNVAALGHLPAWRARPDARIVAVVDIDPARRALAQSLLPDVRPYEDAAALLARERLDFVDVATPPDTHAALILQAMRAGCDVLCEKPLVTTLADFDRVAHGTRAANLALVTVHNWKHSPQFKRVTELVDDGAVGRISSVQFDTERNGQSVTVGSSWRQQATHAGGGILFDHGWHALYLALALARERPYRIAARMQQRRPDMGDVEDTVDCELQFPSSRSDLRLTWAADQRRTRWRVAGADGTIDLDDDRMQLRAGNQQHDSRFFDSLSAGSHHAEWFDAVIDDFFCAIDDPLERYANLAEAEWCLTLITLAYQSAAAGKPLPVPPGLPALPRPRLLTMGRVNLPHEKRVAPAPAGEIERGPSIHEARRPPLQFSPAGRGRRKRDDEDRLS